MLSRIDIEQGGLQRLQALPSYQRLFTDGGIPEYVKAATSLLADECGYQHFVLWERQPDATERPLAGREGGSELVVRTHPLRVGLATIGRLEVGYRKDQTVDADLEMLSLWLALGLERVRHRQAVADLSDRLSRLRALCDAAVATLTSESAQAWSAATPVANDRGLRKRLSCAREQWKLTAKQTEVLYELVLGHSNKQAAQSLHASEKTIQHHMTDVLRKAGVDSRLKLVAEFWTMRDGGRA